MPSPPVLVDIRQNGKTIPALASDRQERLHVHSRSHDRQADVRRRGAAGAEGRCARRMVFAHAAVSGEAAGARARRVQEGRHRHCRRHDARTRKGVSGTVGQERRVLQRRSVHAVAISRRGGAAASRRFSSRAARRRELGRARRGSLDGYVFVNAHDTSLVGWIEKVRPGKNYGRGTEGSNQLYDRGSVNGPGPYFTFSAPMKDETGRVVGNLPCQRPPWARLVAVNANTGDIAWQVPLGLTEALPEGKRNTGGSGSAGPIATAGGVVIVGATNDRRIRAFDTRPERNCGWRRFPGVGNANPITYTGKNGKQYVAIVATDRCRYLRYHRSSREDQVSGRPSGLPCSLHPLRPILAAQRGGRGARCGIRWPSARGQCGPHRRGHRLPCRWGQQHLDAVERHRARRSPRRDSRRPRT